MQQSDRIREQIEKCGFDAIVCSEPADVVYSTGYRSVLEQWGLTEPVAASIIFKDAKRPVVLVIPEALVALDTIFPTRAGEFRVFDLTNFCEVLRTDDPTQPASTIGQEAVRIYGQKVKGRCEQNIIEAIEACLVDHGLQKGHIGVDDLRIGSHLKRRLPGVQVSDALDAMMTARIIKTPAEIEEFYKVGKVADQSLMAGVNALHSGVKWNDVQQSVVETMTRLGAIPVDEGGLLFGGVFKGEFIPELFRTRTDRTLDDGQVVIVEVLGKYENLWFDLNRTATIGKPTPEFQKLHDSIRDAYVQVIEKLRPGAWTGDLARMAQDALRSAGVQAPQRLVLFAHSVGHVPFEMPQAYPAYGRPGDRGFLVEENMVLSVDCLYFGGSIGPCHMENVFVIHKDRTESLYSVPLQLFGPR
jgi:Xaa-Pro aminopeptidase